MYYRPFPVYAAKQEQKKDIQQVNGIMNRYIIKYILPSMGPIAVGTYLTHNTC